MTLLSRAYLIVALIAAFTSCFRGALFADQAFWATDSSGSWTTDSNWSYLPVGLPTVPNSLHDVIIDRGVADPTITLSSNTSSIRSLVANEALEINGGALSLNAVSGSPQSAFNNSFSMSDGTLTLSGANTTLNINGPTPNLAGKIVLSDNARLNWLSSTSFVGPTTSSFDVSVNSGSLFDMSHVTSYSPGGAFGSFGGMSVNVTGGTLDLSGVTSIASGKTRLIAQSNGQILLDELVSLHDDFGGLFAFSGAIVSAPKLTTLNNSGLWVESTGQISAPLLNNIDGSGLTVQSGGTIALPLVTSYVGPSTGGIAHRAYDAGSVLDLSHVTSFAGSSTASGGSNLLALGGTVDLSSVSAITTGSTYFQSVGATSLVKLDSLVTYTSGGSLRAREGGTINAPLLAKANDVEIEIDSEVGNSLLIAPLLAQIDRSSILLRHGAELALPLVTSYAMPADKTAQFTANWAGSKLDLSHLSSITAPEPSTDPQIARLQIRVENGGEIQLTALQSLNAGPVGIFAVDGVIDLDHLTAANQVTLRASADGAINAPMLTTITNGQISKYGSANFALNQVQNIDGTSVTAEETLIALPLVTSYSLPAGAEAGFYASGAAGSIDLSNLTSVTMGAGARLRITTDTGAAIDLSQIEILSKSTFDIYENGTVLLDELMSLNYSEVSQWGNGQFYAPQLMDVDGTSFLAFVSATQSFPGVVSYDGLDVESTITAYEGVINFPNLTHFSGSTAPNGTSIYVYGGVIDLSNVTEFSGGKTLISGFGFDEQQLRLNPGTTILRNVTIENYGGVLTGGTIDLQNGSEIQGSGDLAINVLNSNGTVNPGFDSSHETLSIDGTFTQLAGGQAIISLGVAGEEFAVDHLQVTGQATLAGELALDMAADFHPAIDHEFRILDSGGLTGHFARTTGYLIDYQLQLAPFYDATGVTLRVVLSGDANLDRQVDGADYTTWADHFLSTANSYTQGDFNIDGVVDGADYIVWADHFLDLVSPAPTLTAVPEPTSLALAGIGAFWLAALVLRHSVRKSMVECGHQSCGPV